MSSLAPVARALAARSVRYVLIGAAGANHYSPSGVPLFVTQDSDLFVPPDADNLVQAWAACEDAGLELWNGNEPLDKDKLFLATHRDALEQLLKREDRD
jgi:hypothetical protein